MLGHSGTGYFSRKGGLSHPGFGMQCVEGLFLKLHMTYDLGDFLGAAQKATKVLMVGWGHWIGCLHLLVALARPTPESGTEEHGLRQQRKHAQTAAQTTDRSVPRNLH